MPAKREVDSPYTCSRCGQEHAVLPLRHALPRPALVEQISNSARLKRCQLAADTCSVDERFFFVRGALEIPIRNRSEVFTWEIWASVSQEDFARLRDRDATAPAPAPCSGWLSCSLPLYPQTLNLEARIHLRADEPLPRFELLPARHPLYADQAEGILWSRVLEITEFLTHG